MSEFRWIATVYYATDSGLVDVDHDLRELEEIHDRIEADPHWDTVDHIIIRRAQKCITDLTVEAAATL